MPLNILSNVFSGPQLTINLHDPTTLALIGLIIPVVFGFVSVAVAVLVAIYQVRRQRGHKQISYQVLADRPVIRIDDEIKGRIKVEFAGRMIDSMSSVIIKVWNSGDISVKTVDYLVPLTFRFEGRKVLEVNICGIEPANLIKPTEITRLLQENKPPPGNERECVELPTFHLNPKQRGNLQDTLTLEFLLLGSSGKISTEGRIDEGNVVKFKMIKLGSMVFLTVFLIIASIIAFLLIEGHISFAVNSTPVQIALLSAAQRLHRLIYFF